MKLFFKVPTMYENGYRIEQRKYNFKHLLIIGIFIHLVQIGVYLGAKAKPFSDNPLVMKGYFTFYEVSIVTSIPFLIFLFWYVKKKGIHKQVVTWFLKIYTFMIMYWAMGVAISDQFQGEDVVVYYIVMFLIALAVDVSLVDLVLVLAITQGFLIGLMPIYGKYVGDVDQLMFTSFQFVFFSILIRYYVHELRKKNYAQRMRLESVNDELYYLSFYDPLSKLYNRRRWEEDYHKMYEKALAEQKPIDVIITDIDYFKHYNDTYGHVAGDQIIRTVSRLLIEATEGYDRNIGRYGGDEFAMSFYGLSDLEVFQIIDGIKARIKNKKIDNKVDDLFSQLTMSFGCYRTIPSDEDDPWDLIVNADQMLYREKKKRHRAAK